MKTKAKTRTWSDVVKGLEEDELEIIDSVEKSDLDETDHVKARRTRRQPKPRSIGGNRRVEGHQYRDNDEVEKGLKSRCTDHRGQGAFDPRGRRTWDRTRKGA